MADGAEASPEAKLNIATYFIMNSPSGEVHDVMADVQKLLSDPSVLGESQMNKILKDYNIDQLTTAPDPANEQSLLMVCAAGLVDENHFLDPSTGRVVKFDHRKQRFTEVTERKQVLDEQIAKYRASIAKAVEGYVNENYKGGKCITASFGADNGKVSVCISAKNTNLANFWTGSWRGVYTVNVDRQGQAELKGSIRINVHYFEDGNVQLHANVNQAAKVNVTAKEDETGGSIAASIAKIENDFHGHLEEMYVKMHTQTFKQMRRFYTLQREPMKWSVAAHAMASEVTANKSQG